MHANACNPIQREPTFRDTIRIHSKTCGMINVLQSRIFCRSYKMPYAERPILPLVVKHNALKAPAPLVAKPPQRAPQARAPEHRTTAAERARAAERQRKRRARLRRNAA